MNRVRVLVEGQTEQAFITDILKPYFETRGTYLHAVMFKRTGGITRYDKAKNVIISSLKEDPGLICTTMVDFYGMPSDWPDRNQANRCTHYLDKANKVESNILSDLKESLGDSFNPRRIVPYVQMHEFEALLFSSPEKLAKGLGDVNLSSSFSDISNKYSNPEEINDNYETCPSRQIIKAFPGFRKTMNGLTDAKEIGLEIMRLKCPHFNDWIGKLEGIGEQ